MVGTLVREEGIFAIGLDLINTSMSAMGLLV